MFFLKLAIFGLVCLFTSKIEEWRAMNSLSYRIFRFLKGIFSFPKGILFAVGDKNVTRLECVSTSDHELLLSRVARHLTFCKLKVGLFQRSLLFID